jgi:hypothetical protein
MKNLNNNWKIYENNRFVIRWYNINTRETLYQGKRQRNDCPLTKAELSTYTTKGTAALLKMVRERTGLNLSVLWPKIRDYRDYKTKCLIL